MPRTGRSATLERYERHLEATAAWLLRSIDNDEGGSCAYFSAPTGWSRPYPETTGYLIPTLIELSAALRGYEGTERAVALGEWLLGIQDAEGWWRGGTHPPKDDGKPSVFNSAQVLHGLVALAETTGEDRWLESASRCLDWLRSGIGASGLWEHTDYRSAVTPSYYTFAAWPMIEAADRTDDDAAREAGEGVLRAIAERRLPNGVFAGWAFEEGKAAFTHTIAYTIQGFFESARVLGNWDAYGEPAREALIQMIRRGEIASGRLPGRIDDNWQPDGSFVCLTGNAQTAICALELDERQTDLRLVNAAARLTDAVCDTQHLRAPLTGVRGAVAGSSPLWGPYMILRYPNWAAKFHCDALLRLIPRLEREWRT